MPGLPRATSGQALDFSGSLVREGGWTDLPVRDAVERVRQIGRDGVSVG